MQNVIENITKQSFDQLVESAEFLEFLQLIEDLAKMFEHYLDMVNLLLNIIHFQKSKSLGRVY